MHSFVQAAAGNKAPQDPRQRGAQGAKLVSHERAFTPEL